MKLIILDRDGVINQESNSINIVSWKNFIPIEGSLEAIAKLKQAGYTIGVATNQSIISKKLASLEDLHEIHNYLQSLLMEKYKVQIDQILICPHQSTDQCNCRKPKIKMLLQIANLYRVNFSEIEVPFVGDSLTDLLAARSAGALPVLVKTGKGMKTKLNPAINKLSNLLIFDNLLGFVEYWIKNNN